VMREGYYLVKIQGAEACEIKVGSEVVEISGETKIHLGKEIEAIQLVKGKLDGLTLKRLEE